MNLRWADRRRRYRMLVVRELARGGRKLSAAGWLSAERTEVRIALLARMLRNELRSIAKNELRRAKELRGVAYDALDEAFRGLHPNPRQFSYEPPKSYQPNEFELRREAEAKAWRERTVVYFIQQRVDGGDGPIKIGVSADVADRVSKLQVGCAYPLVLLATMKGDDTTEYNLHTRFASARLSGEWFRPVPELLAFIATLITEPK